MSFVIPAPAQTILPVEGEQGGFPVRRIYCVGRNYAAHAREMGHDPDREPPFFFMKPADAIVLCPKGAGAPVEAPFPVATEDLHHEIEMVVALGKGGKDIPADKALEHVYGYAVGIDLTRRDIQAVAKKMGRPWDMAKGFDHSAPCGTILPAAKIGHPSKGRIQISVNGTVKQDADIGDMIWNVPDTIAYLSTLVELFPGDLIYSGTPEGVAQVKRGEVMEGSVEGVGAIAVKLV
ncbi:fumarylacetoacetate hydrolase family protein [Oceanibaculum indicum]|uniref:Fumarylacetoacetate (FAA) hydrolase n=2 Tax=Oceanibaculum indicum TaxID=526216 RepID=K2K6V5_9PROT|nr:fumarylacetoacetate hydrolase family protein [Oceanibaculum indicum]EKE78559.1 fumarylacetoacetate (FAA) hydrolase [Oceanibaculum indicum P24]RKQ68569.1 fumarylpyruvate hydrolase [Oceanibaculum indicum]